MFRPDITSPLPHPATHQDTGIGWPGGGAGWPRFRVSGKRS